MENTFTVRLGDETFMLGAITAVELEAILGETSSHDLQDQLRMWPQDHAPESEILQCWN